MAESKDLFRSIETTNPFRMNRVSEPGDVQVDVSSIHGRQFARVKRLVEDARDAPAVGAMLLGPPGVGKSHFLARLHQWAEHDQRVVSVPLHNLQASPERMARYVLKATVSSLLDRRGRFAATRLMELVQSALGEEASRLDARARLDVDPIDDEILTVLLGFLRAHHPADHEATLDWLGGDPIDDVCAKSLEDLGGGNVGHVLPDDAAVERVFVVLARLLATQGKVLVLGLDQVDNLDVDQIRALSAFLHALIDHASNLVVLTSGVKSTMLDLKQGGVVPEAAWDRLAIEVLELQELSFADATDIVRARLDFFFEPFDGESLAALRRGDALFPIGSPWWKRHVGGQAHVRARTAIDVARRRWETQREAISEHGGERWAANWTADDERGAVETQPADRVFEEVLDEAVTRKLSERVARRELAPSTLPPDSDNLATLTTIVLQACAGRDDYSLLGFERVRPTKKGPLPPYDLVCREADAQGREVRTGVAFLTASNATAITACLRRLVHDPAPPEHVLLVTDARRQLRLGPKGREHHEALMGRGAARFAHRSLAFEAYAELDALACLPREARVGDFEVEHPRGTTRALQEEEVVEALHRLDRYRAHALLSELLTEEPGATSGPPANGPLAVEEVRVAIEGFLGWRVGASAREVASRIAGDLGRTEEDAIWQQVREVADEMHREGLLQATPLDEDRFLFWIGNGT